MPIHPFGPRVLVKQAPERAQTPGTRVFVPSSSHGGVEVGLVVDSNLAYPEIYEDKEKVIGHEIPIGAVVYFHADHGDHLPDGLQTVKASCILAWEPLDDFERAGSGVLTDAANAR